MESSGGKRRQKPAGDYVKRPLNAFMVWSRVRRAKLREEMPDLRNTEISRRLGAEWREMSAEQKLPHIQQSRQLRIEHFDRYPNYRYRPRRKQKQCPVSGPRPVADILASRARAPPASSPRPAYRPAPPARAEARIPALPCPNACVSRISGVPVPSALFCNFPYGYTRPSQQVFTATVCTTTQVCPTHNKPTMYPYAYSQQPRPYPYSPNPPLTLTLPSGSGTLHYIPTSLPEVDPDRVTSLPGGTPHRLTSFLGSTLHHSTSLPVSTQQHSRSSPAAMSPRLTSVSPPRPVTAHYSLPPMTSLLHPTTTGRDSSGSPHASAPSDSAVKCHTLQPLPMSANSPSVQLLCTESDEDSDTESCSSPDGKGGSCRDNRLQNLRSCTGLFWATPLASGGGHAKEKVIVESVPVVETVSIAHREEPRDGLSNGHQFKFEWN